MKHIGYEKRWLLQHRRWDYIVVTFVRPWYHVNFIGHDTVATRHYQTESLASAAMLAETFQKKYATTK